MGGWMDGKGLVWDEARGRKALSSSVVSEEGGQEGG